MIKYPKEIKLSAEIKNLFSRLFEKEFKKRISMNEILDHPWVMNEKLPELHICFLVNVYLKRIKN